MSLRIDTRTYTNTILTVIAVFLCLLVFHAYRISVVSDAQAQMIQTPRPTPSLGTGGFSPPGHRAPIDGSNAQLVQDVAVAGATAQVAAANVQIADALRDVASAIREAGAASANVARAPAATVIQAAPPFGGPLPERGVSPASPTPAPESLNISVESAQ